jgi:hypothetical protein
MRLKKNILIVLKELIIWRLIVYVLYVFINFILDFKVVIEEVILNGKALTLTLSYFKGPLVVYLVGTYLTPFPWYIVLILLFIPQKRVMPILGITILIEVFHAIII